MDALAALAPVSERYASLPVADAFDWSAVGPQLGDGAWYLVAFRSVRRADADEAKLDHHDEMAHREAQRADGYIHYFRGPKAPDGSCLSFCLWSDRDHARAAAGQPMHVEAVGLLPEMYDRYALEFLRVTRRNGGPLEFEPYDRLESDAVRPPAAEIPSQAPLTPAPRPA